MNWLAHVFLSGDDVEHQLGNLLADPLRGRIWPGASESLQMGMALHRRIDQFTDSHPLFKQSCSRLGRQGRLRAVVMDVVYDHFLSRNWSQYCAISLQDYTHQFHRNALMAAQHFPYRARTFITNLVLSDRLASYGSWEGLISAFERMDERLSSRIKAKECTCDYLPLIDRSYDGIEKDFFSFFSELMSECGQMDTLQ